jgi:formate--tetrahydrofolate ligase
MTTTDKVIKLCRDYYGAQSVDFSKKARSALRVLDSIGLPICVAKTQYSFSDDPKKIGATDGFAMTVEDVSLSNGAGFVVIYMGDIVTMPGLPEKPAALSIDVSDDGVIEGLF